MRFFFYSFLILIHFKTFAFAKDLKELSHALSIEGKKGASCDQKVVNDLISQGAFLQADLMELDIEEYVQCNRVVTSSYLRSPLKNKADISILLYNTTKALIEKVHQGSTEAKVQLKKYVPVFKKMAAQIQTDCTNQQQSLCPYSLSYQKALKHIDHFFAKK
ncbi:MAG: hypothetical protein CL678_04620 [Bdellovibrionaceae bacterium]|nr:hypothetical protein [Pseudobdellovibrionaceae bacterium]|tara:strand:+ start:949 stop:1434 length:486 start_codon:yes stop_codon:yes gene_type:complete